MKGRGFHWGTLTNAEFRQAVFLTLAMFLILISRLSHADTIQDPNAQEIKNHINEAENYLRKESLRGLSLLPDEARQVMGLFSGWHKVDMSQDGDAPTMTEETTDTKALSFPLATSLHHKGFLPMHDTMMLGISANRDFLGDKLQFTARPFYGQSWHSLRGYWGGEIALNMAQHADGLPWGKISMGYVNGDESMTDHGRGVDLHGDVDLTNHFSLTSGMRQNSITGNANYALLQWKISFGGNP
jgi:hypothetical protein